MDMVVNTTGTDASLLQALYERLDAEYTTLERKLATYDLPAPIKLRALDALDHLSDALRALECQQCERDAAVTQAEDYDDTLLCESCCNDYVVCARCRRLRKWSEITDGMCLGCQPDGLDDADPEDR